MKSTICPCGLRAQIVVDPPIPWVAACIRTAKPAALHYHRLEYWEYLYDTNPFIRGIPWAVGSEAGGAIESVITAVGVPTTVGDGALLAAWYQAPVIHDRLGGANVLAHYLALPKMIPLLAYDPNVAARSVYRSWTRFDATRWAWRSSPRLPSLLPRLTTTTLACPNTLDVAWDALAQEYPVSISRVRNYWRWKFRSHPSGAYRFYATDPESPRVAFAVAVEEGVLRIEDVVFVPDTDLTGPLATLLHAEHPRSAVLETNAPEVAEAAKALGFTPEREPIPLFWRHPPPGACYRSMADADFGVRRW